ncbi:MAG: S41 family peptidase [Alphaproteobacteria bacterium]|nr:S41 family peptidase [Alphaproteobacteria bacterium]
MYTPALRIHRFLALAAIAVFCLQPAYAQEERTAGSAPEKKSTDYSETYRQLQLFGDVFERVREQYVEPVEDPKLIENAINGMLSSLDPHSSYLNEKDYADMQVQTKGEFGGLGIEVTMENGLVKVVSPIDDTPAFRAGIKAGDYITNIDKQPVMGMSLNDAVEKMRGKVGSKVELTVRREGVAEPIPMSITRDIIKIQSVRHRVEGNVGYIRITTFNQNSESGVIKAVDDIKKQLGSKLVGFVLDLRNNPGGLLDQAIAVSDLFLDKGEIVSTRGRHESDTKRDNATPGDIIEGLPIVVLINNGSASASEIVSGALPDHKRAIILGVQSFGKGSVQTVIPLPSHGAMRLTTARYYTPSGRSIQAKGIEPDIVVEPAKVERLKGAGSGFHEADLKGALVNEEDKGKESAPPAEEKKPAETGAEPAKDGEKEGEEEVQDYQLLRALDLLNGLSLYQKPPSAPNP